MTTPDVEGRVERLLRADAQFAMDRTDTEARLGALLHDLDVQTAASRRTRRHGVVAAAAAIAAAIGLWSWLVPLAGDRDRAPARQPAPDVVSLSFLRAFGDFDRDGAASHLAPGVRTSIYLRPTDPGVDPWRAFNRWLEAVDFTLLDPSCVADPERSGRVQVHCSFDFHMLGSEELGAGPFRNNLFIAAVQDGSMVEATMWPNTGNNLEDAWEPFAAWVTMRHPSDAPLMYDDWPDREVAAIDARSTALWERHLDEYISDRLGRTTP